MKPITAVILGMSTFMSGQLLAQENDAQPEQPQRPDPFARFFTLPGIEFSESQQAKVAEIEKEFRLKLAENLKKWTGIVTAEQSRARSEAFRKARDAGLKGDELRAAVSDAFKLSDEQRQQQQAVQAERNKLAAEIRTKLIAVLPAEQRARFQRRRQGVEPIPPTHANVKYGEHERNVLDVWLAKSDKPTPLVIYIHGGGFRGGSKEGVSIGTTNSFLRNGISVAAINYRLTTTDPFPAAHHDSARAVQFLRHKAKEWNLDPKRFGATGGSAGGGVSLWLAFHDDLADPDSDDPIARESTRLTCVAVTSAQSSYDPRFGRKIGLPRIEEHGFFLPFYGIKRDEIDSPKAHKLYDEAAAITHLTKDDVPVMTYYSGENVPITDKTSVGVIIHHPKFGIALKERMDELGIECVLSYRGQPDRPTMNSFQFFQKHFGTGAN